VAVLNLVFPKIVGISFGGGVTQIEGLVCMFFLDFGSKMLLRIFDKHFWGVFAWTFSMLWRVPF
jgi:hypothetical protein